MNKIIAISVMLTPFIFLIGCGTDDDSEGILFPEKNQFIFNDTI